MVAARARDRHAARGPRDFVGRGALARVPGEGPFEAGAHVLDAPRVGEIERRDAHSPGGQLDDERLGLEQPQRLAHRGPRDAELGGEHGLGEPRVGREGTVDDAAAQQVVDRAGP